MKRSATTFICLFSMGILILDTKTALLGAVEGIELCLKTVIPSLFPFIVLSMLLTSALLGSSIPLLKPIGKILRIPDGSESLWLTGCLGGYPVGAQCIGQAVKSGILHPKDGKRMLCFCNNAGPSFIFGIGMGILGDLRLCFFIWLIHILSSIIVGMLTPGKAESCVKLQISSPITLPQALAKATATMGMICGWVVLFKILLRILQKWILAFVPTTAQVLLSGILELSNGCTALWAVENRAHRFILFSAFLAFGGVCVAMQTASVAPDTRWYLPSKIAQAAVSGSLSILAAGLLFPGEMNIHPMSLILCGTLLFLYPVSLRKFRKKALAFSPKLRYNRANIHTR